NPGGYLTLSFIPTLGTMLLGLIAGDWLRSAACLWNTLAWRCSGATAGMLAGFIVSHRPHDLGNPGAPDAPKLSHHLLGQEKDQKQDGEALDNDAFPAAEPRLVVSDPGVWRLHPLWASPPLSKKDSFRDRFSGHAKFAGKLAKTSALDRIGF